MVVTDFDGTIRTSQGTFGKADMETLHRLGAEGFVRVIATGRSVFSLRRAITGTQLPIDYVIFSSGAGIWKEPGGEIVRKISLEPAQTTRAERVLLDANLDFMIHLPVPDSHRFGYHATGADNPDFTRRIELYHSTCWSIDGHPGTIGSATQLLAVVPPPGDEGLIEALRKELTDLTVIRTTSPLDGRSTWIEIFPGNVSKGQAASWLAGQLGIGGDRTLAVGNDYNDIDLLDWAHSAFVVGNAPADLHDRYPVVASNDEDGLAEAVERWLAGVD
jgi:hydroxymethylpyrimidine pyrophosphatase-like HAD family hydrolase